MSTTALRSFEYKTRNTSGKLVKGRLEATNESAAAAKLSGMGLTPVAIKEASAQTGLNRDINIAGFSKGVSLKDLAVMTRQLSTMIAAGLSLLRALTILADQTENKKLAGVLGKVVHDVEVGGSLSDSMAKYPIEFPPLMINMVRAGEIGGFLDSALDSIAQNFEKEAKLRATVKSAMAYPVMVLALSGIAVVLMLLFIVPVFKDMFEGLGSELPLPTQALVSMSSAMVYILPIAGVAFIIFSFWWNKNKNTDAVQRVVDPIKLKLPIFGGLMKKIAVARFTRTLGTLLQSGVPILDALEICAVTAGNVIIQAAVMHVRQSISEGKNMAEPLTETKVFPDMVVQMIAVGEQTGALDQMLNKIADFYEEETDVAVGALTASLEPIMMVGVGGMVGVVLIAMYLPAFSLAGNIHAD